MTHEAVDAGRAVLAPPSEAEIFAALRRCYDPCCKEKQISVVDMGLVERVRIDGAQVGIDIVLTSGWCPFSMHMLTMLEQEVGALDGVSDVSVNITWDSVWTPERLSEEARAKLRLPMERLLPLREARLRRQAGAPNQEHQGLTGRDETGQTVNDEGGSL
jgi:metal-sulfur cluster biosynthetic enzyme